jgi:D-alanyl-D-alanine carboxypeptidase/D-alanyl-D-alanine-endopeptidase (penicillin-binding protein 4)
MSCMLSRFVFLIIAVSSLSHVPLWCRAQQEEKLKKLKECLANWDKNDDSLKYGQVSFSLRQVKEGKPILEYNAFKSFIPASNLKLLTTASALEVLGETYTFKTFLEYSGNIDSRGILHGNIILRGNGDPTFGSQNFKSFPALKELLQMLSLKVKEAGIKSIEGNVIADGSLFGYHTLPETWAWADIGNYYGAPAWGLNINDNSYKIIFKPGKTEGDSSSLLRTDPVIPGLELTNMVTTGKEGSGDNAYVYGGPYQYTRYITGTIPKGPEQFAIKGSLPDPAALSAHLLYDALRLNAIDIKGKSGGHYLPDSAIKNLIYEHHSPPLREIIQFTNMQSFNLYAEAMYKMIGLRKNTYYTPQSAADVIKKIWKSKGLEMGGLKMTDGCGLSFTNAMATSEMTGLLAHLYREPYFKIFYNSLPVSGISGTMSRMGKGTAWQGKISAKTGTQTQITCYSGYVSSPDGLLAFSLFINNYQGSPIVMYKKIESFFALLATL